MADPPKKPGSLRDRIAAFENKGPAPAPAPAPRPKPAGGVQWKPRAASPPASPPRNSSGGGDVVDRKTAGLSASDAKESITKAGSLKERMAALQGRSGFAGAGGAGASTSPPPRPASEKPKWKPPPQPIASPEPEDGTAKEHHEPKTSPTGSGEQHGEEHASTTEAGEAAKSGNEEEGEKEVDPQEEERQRRAAIAARMAKLGGARVGMGPPIFGKKPEVKRKEESPKEEVPAENKAETTQSEVKPSEPQSAGSTQSDVPAATPLGEIDPATSVKSEVKAKDYFDAPTAKDPSASLSPDAIPSSASTPKTPSMPAPAMPKRAGPPRKKAAKSPSPVPPPQVLDASIVESPEAVPVLGAEAGSIKAVEAEKESKEIEDAGSREPELKKEEAEALIEGKHEEDTEAKPSSGSVEEAKPDEVIKSEPLKADEVLEEATKEEDKEPSPPARRQTEDDYEEPKRVASVPEVEGKDDSHPIVTEPEEAATHEGDEKPAEPAPEAEDDDEEARRKRIAERVAKMGGFNPFSGPPPVRRPSGQSSTEVTSPVEKESSDSVPPPERRASLRKESSDSYPPPERRSSIRKESSDASAAPPRRTSVRQGSVDSIGSQPLRSPPVLPTSPKPELPQRKDSLASVKSSTSAASERKASQDGEY